MKQRRLEDLAYVIADSLGLEQLNRLMIQDSQ